VASNLTLDDTRVLWDTGAYEANTTQPLLTYPPDPISPLLSLATVLTSGRCIFCILWMQVGKSPISLRQEFWEVTSALLLACISLNHIHLYQVTPHTSAVVPFPCPRPSSFFTGLPSQLLFTFPFILSEIDGSEYVCDLQFWEKIMEQYGFMERGHGLNNCDGRVKSPRGMRRHGFDLICFTGIGVGY
jgi:hypothetical protein